MQPEVDWPNVIALVMTVTAVIVVIKTYEYIVAFLGRIKDMGPGHPVDDQLWGLVAFGLVAVTILGVIRILTRRRD